MFLLRVVKTISTLPNLICRKSKMCGQALVKSYVCFKKENGFEKKDLFFPEGLRVELQFKSVRYDHYELENCTKEREKMASNSTYKKQ